MISYLSLRAYTRAECRHFRTTDTFMSIASLFCSLSLSLSQSAAACRRLVARVLASSIFNHKIRSHGLETATCHFCREKGNRIISGYVRSLVMNSVGERLKLSSDSDSHAVPTSKIELCDRLCHVYFSEDYTVPSPRVGERA